jgi:hypothetical protein
MKQALPVHAKIRGSVANDWGLVADAPATRSRRGYWRGRRGRSWGVSKFISFGG